MLISCWSLQFSPQGACLGQSVQKALFVYTCHSSAVCLDVQDATRLLIGMSLMWGYTNSPQELRGDLWVNWPLLDVWLLAILQTLLYIRSHLFGAGLVRRWNGHDGLLSGSLISPSGRRTLNWVIRYYEHFFFSATCTDAFLFGRMNINRVNRVDINCKKTHKPAVTKIWAWVAESHLVWI